MNDLDDAPTGLDERITAALGHEARRIEPRTPSADVIRDATRRHDRRRQVQLGSVLAAAAVVVVAIVVARPGDDTTTAVDTGPASTEAPATSIATTAPTTAPPDAPKPPTVDEWPVTAVPVTSEPVHLLLEVPGVTLYAASELGPEHESSAPIGPEGRSVVEEITYQTPGTIDGPVLSVMVRTTQHPTELTEPALLTVVEPTTIGGRPGTVATPVAGSASESATIRFLWDDTHEVTGSYVGMDQQTAEAALATVEPGPDGRLQVTDPPSGLEEIAREVNGERFEGWYQDSLQYEDPTIEPVPGLARQHTLSVRRVQPGRTDDDLIASSGSWNWPQTVERTTVRGHPALVSAPSSRPSDGFRYSWFEPEHDVIVSAFIATHDRARADQLVGSIREVSTDEWNALLVSCTRAQLPPGLRGGACGA